MPELWQPIEGYEGVYEVSNQGKVRRSRDGKTLKPHTTRGYLQVTLSLRKVKKKHYVHRLVAKAFVPGDPSLTVNHVDGDKSNNSFDNLEWVSQAGQVLHAYRTGLKKSKLDSGDCEEIEERYAKGETMQEIGDAYGVSAPSIHYRLHNSARTLH